MHATSPPISTAPQSPIKVLFVLGWVRSGSTILDNLLGEIDGFFSSGELRWLWERGLVNGWLCGCGEPVPTCPVWSRVIATGFPEGVDPESVATMQREAVRLRYLPRLLRERPGVPSDRAALRTYLGALGKLYPAIASTTGARVIVDSSKFPQDAAALRLLPNVEPFYVHLVRDARAVAHSNRRNKTSQPSATDPVAMRRHSPLASAAIWSAFNLAAEAVRRKAAERSLLLRYEDLVEEPRVAIERVLSLLGEPASSFKLIDERSIELHGNHTVWGNPGRFKRGVISLRRDDEWLDELRGADRAIPTALALPLLLRYGYPVKVS